MFESLETSTLIISFIAGLFIGVPTGPAQFFVIDTCVKEGKIEGLKVYAGLFTVKLLYAFLAFAAGRLISVNKHIESIILLVAAFLLILWGIFIVIKSNKESGSSIQLNFKSSLKKGFFLGITNPAIPFVYLTFVQIIRAYSGNAFLFNYLTAIVIFEVVSFVTLSLIALLVLIRKRAVLNHWNKVKLVMGVFIACIGAYQVYQHVEFDNGLKIKSSENVIEKQMENIEDNK